LVGELIARVTRNLVAREPPRKGSRLAAVSIIVRDRQVSSVLLIKRAERLGDPWSGQIAFPGGKMKAEDRTSRDTAVRETMEEVGIDLNRSAEFLGYGGVATTHTGAMDVVPSVFVLKEEVDVRPNEEVASFRWVDLDDLIAPKARSTYDLHRDRGTVGTPAYAVEDYIIWGLTYRILSSMLEDSR
jgi:8-oxo-dGTP pyrophosphatase MutT (NUDIX family)